MISAIITKMPCLFVCYGFAHKLYKRDCCYLENSHDDHKEYT